MSSGFSEEDILTAERANATVDVRDEGVVFVWRMTLSTCGVRLSPREAGPLLYNKGRSGMELVREG